jgi:serine/threonine-protein kinase RsbW
MKRTRQPPGVPGLQQANDLPWKTLEFNSCLGKARQIEQSIIAECQAAGFSECDLFGIKLSLEEALVNAVKHGNHGDPCKCIQVRYRVTRQRADITIEDQGCGFDPGVLPDPLAEENIEKSNGRGILLMRAYMSSVVFNPQGNKVTLTKFNENYVPERAMG